MIKQVIIVRKDLNMRKGKMCAQVAHASMKVFFDRMIIEDFPDELILGELRMSLAKITITEEMKEWMQGSFTKIVVGCNSEQEILDLEKQTKEANIPYALIKDNGVTEFKEKCSHCGGSGWLVYSTWKEPCPKCGQTGKVNKPTVTCLAIGPDQSEKIDLICKDLKLL